jgi:hypothetical protein
MNNNLSISFPRLGRVYLLASLNLVATVTFAQTPAPAAIKGTKTDNSYANTTEVSKVKGSSDAQVLSEIEGDYGIGDVVRIVITTPKPVTDPLGGSTNRTPSGIKMTPPTIQISPNIGNRPAPEQETTPPQYTLENKQPNASLPTPVTATPNGQLTPNGNRTPQGTTTTPQYNKPNGQMTPIANRPVPQQATKQPVFEYYNSKGERIAPPNADGTFPNGKLTPIANRPVPQQGTKPPVFEYYNSKGERIAPPTPPTLPNDNRANPNGQMTPIANRPTAPQGTKPPVFEYYNSKGERIPPPNVNKPNPNAQTPPIANRPAPQQTTTPPQYNSPNGQPMASTPSTTSTPTSTPNTPNGQTTTPTVESKSPFSNTSITASTSDKLDLTNVTQKEDGGRNETTTNASIRTPRERIEREERQERRVSPSSGRVASGGRSSRASKSSGFSFKDIFSGIGNMGLKETKRRKMKSHRKYGCYRFN